MPTQACPREGQFLRASSLSNQGNESHCSKASLALRDCEKEGEKNNPPPEREIIIIILSNYSVVLKFLSRTARLSNDVQMKKFVTAFYRRMLISDLFNEVTAL